MKVSRIILPPDISTIKIWHSELKMDVPKNYPNGNIIQFFNKQGTRFACLEKTIPYIYRGHTIDYIVRPSKIYLETRSKNVIAEYLASKNILVFDSRLKGQPLLFDAIVSKLR